VIAKAEDDIQDYWPEEAAKNTPDEQASTPNIVASRDPDTIKTINDLYVACNKDFNMQPSEVLKELGYKTKSDINEKPSELYTRIKAMKGGE
jgi:hypothetical protein